ncbi:MAG: hypothetical protein LQ349_007511 [Xanthoria aureola]|nr:MAG: hypothetical protein LQ349_007511 [Xanthoria aureola]
MAAKSSRLLHWYGSLPARRVDLVGDYAGQELFIVEGDGLLLRCFDDPKIDFTDGFQLLHAVYAVERFLQGLLQRKCVFHLVFFETHKELCIPRATPPASRNRYLLARAIIVRHLEVHLHASHPAVKIYTFSSVLDPLFQDYLKASGAYFIMTHDGANPCPPDQDPQLKGQESDIESIEREEFRRRVMFRSSIFAMIDQGYNIALIDGLEWMDTKIMTTVVEGSRKSDAAISIDETAYASRFTGGEIRRDIRPQISEDSARSVLEEVSKLGARSERLLLTLVALKAMETQSVMDAQFATAMLIQTLLIAHTSLSNRRLGMPAIDRSKRRELDEFLANFVHTSARILQQEFWNDLCTKASLECDINDMIDGRLFVTVWSELADGSVLQMLSSGLQTKLQGLVDIARPMSETQKQRALDKSVSKIPPAAPLRPYDSDRLTILPFSHFVFDKHLQPISITVQASRNVSGRSAKVFQEVSHWHNAKRRLDPKAAIVLSDRDKMRAMRRNQFFMAEMASYAASLTGVTGKILEPELITVSEDAKPAKEAVERTKENRDTSKQRKGQATKGASNAKAIIAANVAAKGGGVADKAMAAWKTVRANLDAERLQSRYRKSKAYLRDLSSDKRAIVQAEVEYYIICTLLKMYRILSKRTDGTNQHQIDGVTALIFSAIRGLPLAKGLTKTIVNQVKSIIQALRLPEVEFPAAEIDAKLSFDPDLCLSEVQPVATASHEFQLLHCGPYMDRNLDSMPDPRVKTFNPDGWQRKVLDELDADRSIFVVAPTSAGKTFISFYAMEKVLRRNDDSVLVYVAPTKALVNQIGAEIQARFKKAYRHAGRSVWAIHTRDYRINNPSGCQILVTVPHILQIMLLSPSNAKSWSRKVRCIIFDEIHSIGQAEDGVVWEQLLLLAPCPIIALSATVGNPEQFNSWLTSTQRSSGFDVTMITHQHRYSDLRKFIYEPPRQFSFTGLPEPSFGTLGLDGLNGLAFVHPVASLVNKSRGIPQDLSLEARDCLTLWKCMCRHQTKAFPVDQTLDPDGLPRVLRKVDIIEWEKKLKALLKSWMLQEDSPFDRIVEDLGKPMNDTRPPAHYTSRPEESSVTTEAVTLDADDLYRTTLPLLCKLQERDALPAILFNYDRGKCERICLSIVKQLRDAETNMKETSQSWKTKIRGYEQYLASKSKQNPKKMAVPKKKGKANDDEGTSKADKMQDAANEEANPYANFNPDAPVEGFHFANIAKAEAAELAAIHKELNRRNLAPWLMESLTRGIGVHHAGMNRKYRQAVEMLFRKGFLRVVIATGTLALGINMPCATVIFSGDSVFLTALNFRQAAGRAGRRGFDLLGNVVFQNLTTAKVCRLLSSRLPDMNGHFPVTTTLVLRLFSLLHESGNTKYAVDAINSLLSQPRLYLDGPAFKDQVLHHLRFSIEYLRRHDLLSAEGVPLNFAGLTSHLYYTENSSFTLNALLKEGYFHELCSEIDTAESRVLRQLMIVMAHLFGRRPCRHSDQEYIENIVKRSPSIVFLPQLPASAAQILREHNEQTLQIFTTYVRTFVDQHIDRPNNVLPLTGISVGGSSNGNDSTDISMPATLRPLPPTLIRSPFVALSGHSDIFTSISDLCSTVRSGVFLEENVIPHLDIYPDETSTPLNAYLYDFYMHGDITALETANGVRKSDVWFLLNDFSLVLATIQTSLANFMKIPEASGGDMEDLVGGGDESNNKDDEALMGDSGYGSAASSVADGPIATSLPNRSTGGKPKKKVEDSWEVAADADAQKEEEEEEAAWDDGDSEDEGPQTVAEMEQGFLRIYKSFGKLKREFDLKFRAMFA